MLAVSVQPEPTPTPVPLDSPRAGRSALGSGCLLFTGECLFLGTVDYDTQVIAY